MLKDGICFGDYRRTCLPCGKEQVILRDVNFFVFALSLSPVVSGLWFQILFYTVSSPVQNLQTYFTEEIAFSQNVLINQ